MIATAPVGLSQTTRKQLRLGFVGVGWIGLNRLEALQSSGLVEVAAIADPVLELRERARPMAPRAASIETLEELLQLELDGVVIATPSALHAEQTIQALEAGLPVFCQKPLGRSRGEVAAIIESARRANLLLGVDLSYRYLKAVQAVEQLVREGALGEIFAARFAFHNAYGPDKPWFYDRAKAGGGCVLDLGIHLVDLASWLISSRVTSVDAAVFAGGKPLYPDDSRVEDFASARLEFDSGATATIECSWRLHAGRDAVIDFELHGTNGGAAVRNQNGSFLDFRGERYTRTGCEVLAEPPDAWGGRAATAWAERLIHDQSYDPEVERQIEVAAVLDAIYGAPLHT